jgi:hypothetical protein
MAGLTSRIEGAAMRILVARLTSFKWEPFPARLLVRSRRVALLAVCFGVSTR